MKLSSILYAAFALAAVSPAWAAETWTGSWTAPPTPAFGTLKPLSNQTVRAFVDISAGGDRLRIRVSNDYGTRALKIGAATVALARADGTLVEGALRPLTFGGVGSISVPIGAPVYSDPVSLNAPDFAHLAISLYLPEETLPETTYRSLLDIPPAANFGRKFDETTLAAAPAQVSSSGDFTRAATLPGAAPSSYLFVSAVDVAGAKPAGAVVVLGTSRNYGKGLWADILARRLAKGRGVAAKSVVNASGIANALSWSSPVGGAAGAARFNRDVLMVPGVTHVILADAINDIGMPGMGRPPPPGTPPGPIPSEILTLGALKQTYLQLVAQAHAHGVKVIAATTVPFNGFPLPNFFNPEKETLRVALNEWIRSGGAFDGVLDFDALLRDPADPSRIKPGLHTADFEQANEAGEQLLAESIDLGLFR